MKSRFKISKTLTEKLAAPERGPCGPNLAVVQVRLYVCVLEAKKIILAVGYMMESIRHRQSTYEVAVRYARR